MFKQLNSDDVRTIGWIVGISLVVILKLIFG
jgi:hypothetical protein